MGIGEDASPGAADVDRDDRMAAVLDDALEAAPELTQHAVSGELPFGEDADHVAFVQGGPRPLDELDDPLPAIAGRDRDHPHQAEEPVQKRRVVDAALHDEADSALVGGGQQQGVHPGDVVGDQERRPLHGEILGAHDADAVKEPHGDKGDETEQEVGKKPKGERGQEQGGGADQAEALGRAELQRPAEKPGESRCHQYPDPVDEAGGGQHFAALGGIGPELDEGLQRQAEEAGGDSEEGDDGQAGDEVVRGDVQQDRRDGEAGRPDGDDAEFHVPAGEFRRQQGAETDAERRSQEQVAALRLGQPQALHAVADQVQLGEGAHEHEVGQADDGQQQVTVPPDAVHRAQDFGGEEGDGARGCGRRGRLQHAG